MQHKMLLFKENVSFHSDTEMAKKKKKERIWAAKHMGEEIEDTREEKNILIKGAWRAINMSGYCK